MKLGALLLVGFQLLGHLGAQTLEEYAQQASQLRRDRQTVEAIRLLEQALGLFPSDSGLKLQLSSMLLEVGQVQAAETYLDRVLETQPENLEALRLKGECRLRSEDFDGAAERYETFLKHSPTGAVYERLAYAKLLSGDNKAALKAAQESVRIDPLRSKGHRFLALLLDLEGRGEEAFQQLKLAYRLAPQDAGLLYHMAQRQQREKKYSQALEFLEMAVELDGENPVYHKDLSFLCDRLGLDEDAIRHANLERRLREAFDDYLRALQIAGQGRRDEAIEFLEESIRDVPEFVSGRLYLADLHQKKGNRKRALELYREVLALNPFQAQALEQSAWLQMQSGALDSAVELLRSAPRESPNQGFFEGYRLLVERNWDGALRIFRDLEKEYPLHPELLQWIGYALNAKGRKAEALSYLDKASGLSARKSEIERDRQDVHFRSALELMRSERWSEALKILEPLLKTSPPLPEYHFNAAYCRQRLGMLDQAIEDYRTGLRQQPEATWARLNLSTSLYLRMRYQEAADELVRVLKEKKSFEAFVQLGICYNHLERLPAAETAFISALKLGAATPELHYNLGLTRWRLGRQEEGWRLIRAAAVQGYGPAAEFIRQAKPRA